jgi:hypothetical protein
MKELASLPVLEGLPSLPRPKLVERWITIHGHPPPKFIKRPFLARAIAWHIQKKVYGVLKPATRRYLLKAAEEDQRRTGRLRRPNF